MLNEYKEKVNLITSSKSADILTAINENDEMIIFDWPRCSNISNYCPFNALEQIKNGIITDAKLKKKARQIIMNSPHVIIFSNELPNITKLSNDRWEIFKIEQDQTVVKIIPNNL